MKPANPLLNLMIRPAEIDDLAAIFHLGEDLFRADAVSNLFCLSTRRRTTNR